MSDASPIERLAVNEDQQAILELVRRDIRESYDFKRTHWPGDRIQNRRRAYRGDPASFTWPYGMVGSAKGPRPVDNWTFRQINHKVGKLARTKSRMTLLTDSSTSDPEVRAQLAALKRRLESKARDAKWGKARRRMLMDSAVTGLGVRAVGLDMTGPKPRITSWPIRAEEYHRDPGAELLEDAAWAAWRRWVDPEKFRASIGDRAFSGGATGADLVTDTRDSDIEFADDQILERGSDTTFGAFIPKNRALLTDYFRKDTTVDIYYTCPDCGNEATVGRVKYKGATYPSFHCPTCETTLKASDIPSWDTMSKGLRYPHGRHIRILGPAEIIYSGPNILPLERIFPFIEMPWYDAEYYIGYSEVELLNSPQLMNNVALAMVCDNAIFNAHPKVTVLKGGMVKPDNNAPDDIIELESDAVNTYEVHAPGQLGEATKVLLEQSIHSTYALAGNDPVAQGAQPDTLRSGVGIARVVAASEVAIYLVQDNLFDADQSFYEICRDVCRLIDNPAMISVPNEQNGLTTDFAYDRTMMTPDLMPQVSTERDIDQEREELFSRALELLTVGDPWMDWDLLHQLSGIPEDLLEQAKQRIRARAGTLDPTTIAQLMPPGAGSPAQKNPFAGAARPNNGQPAGGVTAPPPPGANRLKPQFAGARAPTQIRPPGRSRGAQTPTSPVGGGGFGG